MDTTAIAFTFILVLLAVYFLWGKLKSGKFPPGPKGYPIIGSSFSIDVKNLHISLTELAEKYGDIFMINLFGQTTVVLNSSGVIREAFMKEPNATVSANRVIGFTFSEMFHGPTDIAFSSYSRTWVKRRKLGYRLLKAYGEGLRTIEETIQSELLQTCEEMKKLEGNPFDPEEIIVGFVAQVIAILLTGTRRERDSEFLKSMEAYERGADAMVSPAVTFILDLAPFMRYIPGRISTEFQKYIKAREMFYNNLHKEYEKGDGRGMIHEIFSEGDKNAASGEENWLTLDSMHAIISNMVNGGIITTKAGIWSGIYVLLHRPDVQERLQSEVDGVVGDSRQPSLEDRQHMPYTEACILEFQRYISNLPFLLPHGSSDDMVLRGYTIPKGSLIFPNVWMAHHDSSIYPDPFEFRPERFLDSDGNRLPADHILRQSLLTFGVGKRSCIGEVFAKNRIFLFFATMMQRFTFLPDKGVPPFDPRDMEVLTANMPKRYKMLVKSRKLDTINK